MAESARLILMYVLVPLWVAAGLADWWCHRRTSIETTTGLPENAFHWVLFAEAGLALVAVALLEANAGVLLLVFAAFLAHELTTYVELRFTWRRREIGPFEQMVHSFMELLPLLLLALVAVIAWNPLLALFGDAPVDLGLQPKAQPWPPAYLAAAAATVALLNVLPLAEEGLRCLRTRRYA